MKKNHIVTRISSLILGAALCLSSASTVFAAEPSIGEVSSNIALSEDQLSAIATVFEETDAQAVVVNNDGSIMPMSSLSGYNQATLTSNGNLIMVKCATEGRGGMGITVKTTCSNGTANVKCVGAPAYDAVATKIEGDMTTNSERQWHNLYHGTDLYLYGIVIGNIPDGWEVLTQVWIYG